MIGSDIPIAETQVIETKFYDFEKAQYDLWVKQLSKGLFHKLPNERIVWNMAWFHELLLIMTWLWMRYTHDLLKAGTACVLDSEA